MRPSALSQGAFISSFGLKEFTLVCRSPIFLAKQGFVISTTIFNCSEDIDVTWEIILWSSFLVLELLGFLVDNLVVNRGRWFQFIFADFLWTELVFRYWQLKGLWYTILPQPKFE